MVSCGKAEKIHTTSLPIDREQAAAVWGAASSAVSSSGAAAFAAVYECANSVHETPQ